MKLLRQNNLDEKLVYNTRLISFISQKLAPPAVPGLKMYGIGLKELLHITKESPYNSRDEEKTRVRSPRSRTRKLPPASRLKPALYGAIGPRLRESNVDAIAVAHLDYVESYVDVDAISKRLFSAELRCCCFLDRPHRPRLRGTLRTLKRSILHSIACLPAYLILPRQFHLPFSTSIASCCWHCAPLSQLPQVTNSISYKNM